MRADAKGKHGDGMKLIRARHFLSGLCLRVPCQEVPALLMAELFNRSGLIKATRTAIGLVERALQVSLHSGKPGLQDVVGGVFAQHIQQAVPGIANEPAEL